MVVMWVVVVAVVLVAVGFAMAALFRRPSGDDLHSVRSYHSALGTLEHLSDRIGSPSVRTVEQPDLPSDGRTRPSATDGRSSGNGDRGIGVIRSIPPVPVRGSSEFPDPETPLVFDDARPRDRYVGPSAPDGMPATRDRRVHRHALESMNHRTRRGTTVMIVVAARVLFGVLAYVGSRRSTTASHATTTSTSINPTANATVQIIARYLDLGQPVAWEEVVMGLVKTVVIA